MKNKNFTPVEFIVIVAIIAILVGMLLPALNQARNTARWTRVCKKANVALNTPKGREIISSREYFALVKSHGDDMNINHEKNAEELRLIATGDLDISKTTIPLLQERLGQIQSSAPIDTDDLYSCWADYTGNPRKLTRQQFEVLKDKNLIKLLQYRNFKTLTSSQDLTEEEFKVLRDSNLLAFPKRVVKPEPVKTTLENKGNWK